MSTVKLVKVTQTCLACPSQWDAWDSDGNYYYLRYRHGHGSISRQPSPEEWSDNGTIAEFSEGESLDGYISLEKFCQLTHVDISEARVTSYAEDWSF